MKAVVPLNVAALRVNATDQSNLTRQFKGATATFQDPPFDSSGQLASTGDKIARPLENQRSAHVPLGAGIHLHWELPDFFRRGVQSSAVGAAVVFPAAPNRFLVIRHLSVFDADKQQYRPVATKHWIVESDYLSEQPATDKYGVLRTAVAVPKSPLPDDNTQAFLYMGRVLDAEDWNPAAEQPGDFLPSRTGDDGQPLYLTSLGFVGPAFSSFYPECPGVFGFWDHFGDVAAVAQAITQNHGIRFKAAYQVIGWLNEPGRDPLATIGDDVRGEYADYVAQCRKENVAPDPARNPAAAFAALSRRRFQWICNEKSVAFTLKGDALDSLDVPDGTICAGIAQDIVWDLPADDTRKLFLANPKGDPAVWTAPVEAAVGNTMVEALSALLKKDAQNPSTDADALKNYEYMLNALQLGLLYGLEQQSNKVISLEEALHAKAFGRVAGGHVWIVRQQPTDPQASDDLGSEATLPPETATRLSLLNGAQKDYDQARAALDLMREQLFMDWLTYMKVYVERGAPTDAPDVDGLITALSTFMRDQLTAVAAEEKRTGLLVFALNRHTGETTGIDRFTPAGSLAATVAQKKQDLETALGAKSPYAVRPVPAPPFWMPTDPVVLIEGDRAEPVRRNGPTPALAVRLSNELLTTVTAQVGGATFALRAADLQGRPPIPAAVPMRAEVQAVADEAYLLVPALAGVVADALAGRGGANNPAAADRAGFLASLQAAQGGTSLLDGPQGSGLYEAVRQAAETAGEVDLARPAAAPLQIAFTFGADPGGQGRAPDPVGWNGQQVLPEFSDPGGGRYGMRVDPFMPVFLIWNVRFDALQRSGDLYASDSLDRSFTLDKDGVEYTYRADAPPSFAAGAEIGGSIVLSKRPVFSLTRQIDVYMQNYRDAAADPALQQIKQIYQARKIMAQALSGFNLTQILRTDFPRLEIADLAMGGQDPITGPLAAAARQSPSTGESWYDLAFNGAGAIRTGDVAANDFAPLRAGYLTVLNLEIVDVFGQRMKLSTGSDTLVDAIAAVPLQPPAGETGKGRSIFLPPRLLVPTRLWFRWWSGAHAGGKEGSDFIEANAHPATSPVCGWVVPNHLDNNLLFYDADGTPIGSFGLEHDALKYRTRAGNPGNAKDELEPDLEGVNPHVANFMRYLNGRSPGFLDDLMHAILDSDPFIAPSGYAQDAALAVLIGRPLALTRAVLGLETAGNRLPLNQAGASMADAFYQDVVADRIAYADRERAGSANLGAVRFPLRLGELANLDDGLVGYVIEGAAKDPYGTQSKNLAAFYAPAAAADGPNGVAHPPAPAIELTLNAAPLSVTMLVDPRAAVHATTGILPVEELQIPPDQYSGVLRRLAVTFFTAPILREAPGLTVPLPLEAGFDWSWIAPGSPDAVPLKPNAADEFAAYGYTPQTLLEGWPSLQAAAKPESEPGP
jgi:hypothetical protein